MITFKFAILGIPFAKQSFRFTRTGHKYQPAEVKQNEYNVRLQVINQLPKPFTPFSKAVEILSITYAFPAPKSLKKADRLQIEAGGYVPKTTKPDLTDNLNKGLIDALKGVVFADDSIIWRMNNVCKVYGKTPGIIIKLVGE